MRLLTTLLILACCSVASAQVKPAVQLAKSSGLGLWTYSEEGPHHNSIVKITAPVGQQEGSGTGVVVYVDKDDPVGNGHRGYCMTAYHVVKDAGSRLVIKTQYCVDGRFLTSTKNKVVHFDKELDIALVWTWVPKEVEPVKIAQSPISPGDRIEFCGLGTKSPNEDALKHLRHFWGVAAVTCTPKQGFCDITLRPGDSGGPVFNENHELVGIISGGWFWVMHKEEKGYTWPARFGSVEVMNNLMAKL